MNYKTSPLFLLIALILSAPGCGDSSKQQEPSTPEATIEGTIPVKVGQAFQIRLPANPTGGYGWQYRTELETTHLKEIKRSFQEIPADKVTPEMTGFETWAFKALEPGTTTIELVYKQHWKEDGPPAKTYFANVVIS